MDEEEIYCPHCGKVASIFLFDLIVLLGIDGEEQELRFCCTHCGAEWSEILEVTKLMENL